MAQIKPEKYTPLLKGYLTYPPDSKISALLLEERFEKRFIVTFGKDTVDEHRVTKDLAKLIETIGGNVKPVKVLRTEGKKKLFDIPVEIRKIMKKDKIDGIRIRVTGESVLELVKKIETIKENFSQYGLKPKECLWDRTGSIEK